MFIRLCFSSSVTLGQSGKGLSRTGLPPKIARSEINVISLFYATLLIQTYESLYIPTISSISK